MRRHLTYANVMSTLGVFLALAGGYAVAKITGDGSIRSGQLKSLDEDYTTVLVVPELGRVLALCQGGTTTRVAWANTSGDAERVSVDFTDAASQFKSQPGGIHPYTVTASDPKRIFHVFKNGGADAPQTVVSVIASGSSGDCADRVAAEAVSTR